MTVVFTLRDGTEYVVPLPAKRPRHWTSWAMQRLPYGVDLYGSTHRLVASAPPWRGQWVDPDSSLFR